MPTGPGNGHRIPAPTGTGTASIRWVTAGDPAAG
jgi:hypothetical protein